MELHNRTRYKAGCRCDRCRKAQSDYRKDLRLRSKARVPAGTRSTLKSVPALPSSYALSKPGRVESAVLAEIEGLTTAVNARRLLRARGRWRGCWTVRSALRSTRRRWRGCSQRSISYARAQIPARAGCAKFAR